MDMYRDIHGRVVLRSGRDEMTISIEEQAQFATFYRELREVGAVGNSNRGYAWIPGTAVSRRVASRLGNWAVKVGESVVHITLSYSGEVLVHDSTNAGLIPRGRFSFSSWGWVAPLDELTCASIEVSACDSFHGEMPVVMVQYDAGRWCAYCGADDSTRLPAYIERVDATGNDDADIHRAVARLEDQFPGLVGMEQYRVEMSTEERRKVQCTLAARMNLDGS